MRKISRWLLLLALCSVLGWASSAKLSMPGWPGKPLDAKKMALISQAKVSRAFLLPSDKWLQFPLAAEHASGHEELRVVSTANLQDIDTARREHLQDPGKRWEYAFLLEILDRKGQVLAQQTCHQSANLLENKRPDGNIVGAAFYLDMALAPLAGEVTTINFRHLPGAASVRAKLVSRGPQIVDVVLRLYQPRPVSEQDLAHHWARLSPQQQEELARGSVHDKALLQEQEQQNLLRNARQALGPLGHEGEDYDVRDLYVLYENEGLVQDAPIAAYGVQFDRQQYATLAIPPQGGELRLELVPAPDAVATAPAITTAASGSIANFGSTGSTGSAVAASTANNDANAANSDIHVRWYGTSLFERSANSFKYTGASMRQRLPVKGGLLELDAPQKLVLRAWLSSNGKEQEITPLPQYERVFIAGHDTPVTYALSNSTRQSGLRLGVRSLLPAPGRDTLAHYQAFDAGGKSLAIGQLPVPNKAAHYERLMLDYSAALQGKVLSEAALGFFMLPPKTASFKVWADTKDAPLLVVAHTRPFALAREVRIPDDFYSFDAQGQRIPGWFLLRPQDDEALLTNDRSRLLLLQTRPIEEDENQAKILAGNYQWQDYRPRGNWLARPIFTPREVEIPYREEVLPTTFSPVQLGRVQNLTFPSYLGSSVITPSLIWLGPKQPGELEIRLDGQHFFTLQVHGPYGEYALPALAAGAHRLEIQSSQSGQVLLNYLHPGPASLVKRVGQRFNGELVFDYERTSASAETLTARLYQQAASKQDGHLSVRIEGPPLPALKPLSAWVFAERVASVRPLGVAAGKVFDTEGQMSDAGNPLFLPFPLDAPLGRYRITLRAEVGSQAYVSFSRLSSALQPERRAQQQQEIQSATIIE